MTVLKSIVVCLALANIGYFLWMQGIAPSQAVPAAAPAGRSLQLMSEVPARGAAAPGTTEAGGAGPDRSDEALDAGDGVARMPAAGSLPAAAPPAVAPVPGLAASLKRCVTVGPFKDVSAAAHAASTLRGGGYDPRQRVVDGDVWAGVWVYLPVPATHPASDQLLAKLKAAGIDASQLMPGPADGSVVSLGLFSEQKRAQARVAQVQALGLNPGVADRKRPGNLYWIDVDLKSTDGPLNPADLRGETGHINRLEVKACPTSTPTPADPPPPAAPGANPGAPS